MTEFSRPQAGLFPADGDDCGAYTANEWAAVLIAQNRSGGMMVTGAAAPPGLPATQLFPNVGVFYSVADRLVVSSPGASQITIGTGASIVDGRVHTNDTEHTAIAITNPGANPRIDRVVVRQNYTVADYTSVNAPALVVDFNTARICIISGAENVAPVAPTLTQDEDRLTYWDIPLAQYQISVAGVITNLTDEREYVDAENKDFFVQYTFAQDAATNPLIYDISGYGWHLPTAVDARAFLNFRIPDNYISGLQITPIVVESVVNGNVRLDLNADYGTCSEIRTMHNDSSLANVVAITNATRRLCLTSMTTILASAALGDFVSVYFRRDGTHGTDTLASVLPAPGILVEYFGWGRR